MLTIYGSSTCASCKTLLSMATAQGLEPTHRLIDQDANAMLAYQERDLVSRELPYCVLIHGDRRIETAGLKAGISILKTAKESL